MRSLTALGDMLLELSPEEIIGLLALALVLAIVISLADRLVRRTKADTQMCLICLVMATNLLAMVGGAEVIIRGRLKANSAVRRQESRVLPHPGRRRPGGSWSIAVSRIMKAGDVDRDGRLSPEEASAAAEAFIRQSEGDHAEGPDAPTLTREIDRQIVSPRANGDPRG